MANFCKNCGAALEPSSRFCKACGAQVETAQKSFCPACGRELEPGALFCPGCGAKVGTAAVKAPAARPAPIPAAPRSSSASRGSAAQARNTPQRSSARTPAPEKPKKSRKGLAVFLVLVVLAGLAFAAFKTPGFLVKKKRPDYTFYKWPTAQPSAAPSQGNGIRQTQCAESLHHPLRRDGGCGPGDALLRGPDRFRLCLRGRNGERRGL